MVRNPSAPARSAANTDASSEYVVRTTTRVAGASSQPAGRLDAVAPRHVEVHEDDVGAQVHGLPLDARGLHAAAVAFSELYDGLLADHLTL